jgi:hypothetical protein
MPSNSTRRDFSDEPLPPTPSSRTPSQSVQTVIVHTPIRVFFSWLLSLPSTVMSYLNGMVQAPTNITRLNEEVQFLQHETRDLFQLFEFQDETINRMRRAQHYLLTLLPPTPYSPSTYDTESNSQPQSSLLPHIYDNINEGVSEDGSPLDPPPPYSLNVTYEQPNGVIRPQSPLPPSTHLSA